MECLVKDYRSSTGQAPYFCSKKIPRDLMARQRNKKMKMNTTIARHPIGIKKPHKNLAFFFSTHISLLMTPRTKLLAEQDLQTSGDSTSV